MPKPLEVGVKDMYCSANVASTLATSSLKGILRWIYVMEGLVWNVYGSLNRSLDKHCIKFEAKEPLE